MYEVGLTKVSPAGGNKLWMPLLVATGVGFTEGRFVTVHKKHRTLSLRLFEIPVLVGAVFLQPGLVLAAVAAGSVVAGVHQRRPVLNVLAGAAGELVAVSAGITLYYAWLGSSSPVGQRGWLVATATVALIAVIDLAVVMALAAVVDGRRRFPPLKWTLFQAAGSTTAGVAGALVAIMLISVNNWGVLLFVAVAVATGLAYRWTVIAGQRYANLEKLYDFTSHLGNLAEGRELMASAARDALSLMGASRAEVVVPRGPEAGSAVIRCWVQAGQEPVFEDTSPASALDSVAAYQGSMLFSMRSGDPMVAGAMHQQGFSEALVAPLQSGDPSAGYLLVANRSAQHEGFRPADLRFFETLATNAGVALRSSDLMEQLRREVAVREHQAHHDALTDLPNRLFFSEKLDQALASQSGAKVAVVLIDLDGFKDVNDTLGHVTGDTILREVATRLLPFAGESSMVARLGGDEFAVLLASAQDEVVVEATTDKILSAVTQPCAADGLLLDVRASVGVALAGGEGRERDAGNLMRQADVAMYMAKEAGGGVRFYEPSEERSALRRFTLATELRRAIDQASLEVWYQPVVHLRTDEVAGCEALLRWSHPKSGPISPVEFIFVAENAGLIDPLTWFVLDQALGQLKIWQDHIPSLGVSVNLSARTLGSNKLVDRVAGALARAGVAPGALTLELTETAQDPAASERAMYNLKDLGVRLSIDDYGTGHSSLSRLKHLPFNELKVDRSFVKDMVYNTGDQAIVRSTIELGRNLSRTVTAEGVEDRATLDRLRELGCDSAQGYYLARPLPAPQCTEWLARSAAWRGGVAGGSNHDRRGEHGLLRPGHNRAKGDALVPQGPGPAEDHHAVR